MAIKIGVIAEDSSDVEVIKEFLAKYMQTHLFQVKPFVGKGCGKLRAKCSAWVDNLSKAGCQHIFIFHDLDRNKEVELRKQIADRLKACTFPNIAVIIPTEELEAWLLSDMAAIKSVFKVTGNLTIKAHCEQISSPKEYLGKLIRQTSQKPYLNTVHNQKIASKTSIASLMTCESYKPFNEYVTTHLK